jgi:hypothetical protein
MIIRIPLHAFRQAGGHLICARTAVEIRPAISRRADSPIGSGTP